MPKLFQITLIILLGLPLAAASENYPGGARAISLSNAFVSIADTWSTFHNQAGIANSETTSAGVFFESKYLIDELSLAAGTIVLPLQESAFGICFYQFGEGTFKEHKLGLSYAKRLSEKLNAAIQLDYFSKQFPENKKALHFVTFECGSTFKATKHLTFGAHIFNPLKNGFETPAGKQKIAAIFRIGGHYSFSDMMLLVFETQKNSDYDAIYKTGIEFLPVKNMALRFGVSGRPVRCSAGIGYSIRNITTDIAFSYHGNLGVTPSVSIQFKL